MKLPLYASCLVAEVWIIDVKAKQIEVYKKPQEGFYTEQQVLDASGTIHLAALDVRIPVKDLLG